ncbi:MAG: hypothetical protein WA172_06965 [Terriglobales bacterium]
MILSVPAGRAEGEASSGPLGYTYASAVAGFMSRFGNTGNIVADPTFAQCIADAQSDYTARVKFVEKRFNLQPLTARDGWANTSDMSDFVDYTNPHWTTPPANPPTDNSMACYDGLP